MGGRGGHRRAGVGGQVGVWAGRGLDNVFSPLDCTVLAATSLHNHRRRHKHTGSHSPVQVGACCADVQGPARRGAEEPCRGRAGGDGAEGGGGRRHLARGSTATA